MKKATRSDSSIVIVPQSSNNKVLRKSDSNKVTSSMKVLGDEHFAEEIIKEPVKKKVKTLSDQYYPWKATVEK